MLILMRHLEMALDGYAIVKLKLTLIAHIAS
jgi:hypothetical protein